MSEVTTKLCRLTMKGRECREIPRPDLYVQDGCIFCGMTKGYLRGLGVKYKEHKISSRNVQKVVALTGQTGVPVIKVGKQIIIGWNKQAINKALGIK